MTSSKKSFSMSWCTHIVTAVAAAPAEPATPDAAAPAATATVALPAALAPMPQPVVLPQSRPLEPLVGPLLPTPTRLTSSGSPLSASRESSSSTAGSRPALAGGEAAVSDRYTRFPWDCEGISETNAQSRAKILWDPRPRR